LKNWLTNIGDMGTLKQSMWIWDGLLHGRGKRLQAKVRSLMKMRSTHQPDDVFEAEITTDHPASIPGPLAFVRKDTGEWIALDDCQGLPGTPFKKYDILEADADERARFETAGFMMEEVAPIQRDDLARVALPVLHIDFLGSGSDAVSLIWIDLSERPDLVQMAQGHRGEQGFAECTWHAPDLVQRDASIYFRLQARIPTQSAMILGFHLATYHINLLRIASDRFLWVMGGPRPDYLLEEYAADPTDLVERLRAARGEGIRLGLHPVLALQLETLVKTWREAQGQNR
jgi:hypothetical protein